LKKLEQLDIPIVLGVEGSKIMLGENELSFLYPSVLDFKNMRSPNDYSIVNLYNTSKGDILFTGDLEIKYLENLLLKNLMHLRGLLLL
jgi:beta-lactamase superfamily II metal-dependent hydrolase